MKITDLELEQYGIYQNESWKPAAGCLNVIMGENESGKTTLLRFIRDMMFGYERGKWQGKKGNMGFLRADGSAYRIYRDGKNKWAVNDKGEEFNDELSSLWWHGLNRGIYEKIFAVDWRICKERLSWQMILFEAAFLCFREEISFPVP